MATNSNGSRGDEILKGECVKSPLRTPGTLDGIVDVFHHQVSPLQIVASSLGVLLVEDGLVLFEPLCLGVVDILGKGNESRRRRSIGSRHFVWRMG